MRHTRRSALLYAALSIAGDGLGQAPGSSSDADALRALHEKVLRAHRESDVEMLLADEAVDNVVASRGELLRPSMQDRRAMLGSYLSRTRFEEYRDAVEPVVKVSRDGAFGRRRSLRERRPRDSSYQGHTAPRFVAPRRCTTALVTPPDTLISATC